MASRNPTPLPKALVRASGKVYSLSMLLMHTPSTAQLVVIRGRYTPRERCRAGRYFFKITSTSWTRAAMTRIKTMVWR